MPQRYATRASAHLELDLFNSRFVPLPLHSSFTPLQSRCMCANDLGIKPHILHTLQCEAAALVMERIVLRPETLAVIRPQGNSPLAEVLFNTKVSMQFSRSSNHSSHMAPLLALCAGCVATGEETAAFHARCVCGGVAGCSICVGRPMECPHCGQLFTREWTYETGSGRSSIGRDIKR